jgi:hypothetical protein
VAVFVAEHIPHIVAAVVALGFLARMAAVMLQQPPTQLDDEEIEQWWQARRERAYARRVRRATARLGLWALGPLLVAFATGLWMYTLALRGDRPSGAVIWAHSLLAVAGLVLATWKLADLGWATLRRGLDVHRALTDGVSLVLAALGVPLLVTGGLLLLGPGSGSADAYVHLVASVWWGVLFGAHLMRYLGRAVDAALRGRDASEARLDAPLPRASELR